MRRGLVPEVFIADGSLYGFNLGSDFVAEHEWGIKELNKLFKISNVKKGFLGKENIVLGVDSRTITTIPKDFLHYGEKQLKNKTYSYLIGFNDYYEKELNVDDELLKSFEIYPYREDKHIFTAWDGRSFGILVDETYKKELEELYNAFQKKDIVVTIGKGEVFKNGGLLLIIRSNMSKEELEGLYEKDLDYVNLQNASKETGIKEVLEKANKRYFALTPRWETEDKTSVIFWLNPIDQHIYNSGWYTVEDLKLWVNNEGPIVIARENK